MLRAEARIDTGAIERNCARLAALAPLCAVVKADGYGHGAVVAARAAQIGGATWIAVATANEAAELREAGVGGPILVLGALSREELDIALEARADVVAWREDFVSEGISGAGPRRVPRHSARGRRPPTTGHGAARAPRCGAIRRGFVRVRRSD